MNFRNLILTGAALLMATPTFAATYYGGFEDLSRSRRGGSDSDYNDVVFSLSGGSLLLNSGDGKWYSNPTINNNGKPFWDNASWDGTNKNVGHCIYGGGNCGAGIAPGSEFLASNSTPDMSATDVYFTSSSGVSSTLFLTISAADNTIFWYSLSDFSDHVIGSGPGTFTFTPNGAFGLGAYNSSTGFNYYSQARYNDDQDPNSHFAFFQPTPEPGTMGAMAGGLILLGTVFRRRKVSEQK